MLLGNDMGAYHTYDEMSEELQTLAAEYPAIARLHDLGVTWEGRHIWAIKVSDHPELEEADEPELLYIGNIHAREIITPEVVMHFLNHLLNNYETDAVIRNLVQTRQFWLVPMMNPDGHWQIEKGNRWWRKNRRPNPDSTYGVDLNRNFSYQWGYDDIGSSGKTWSETYRGPAPFSEPESQAIRNLVRAHHFVAAMSYHSYGRQWLFSWSYIAANTPHHDIFLELAGNMTRENGYQAGNVSMGAIYLVNGDTDDYFYGEQNEKEMILGFTPEIGEMFLPLEADIPKHLAETLPANLYLAQVAHLLTGDPWRLFAPATPALSVSPGMPADISCFTGRRNPNRPIPRFPLMSKSSSATGWRSIMQNRPTRCGICRDSSAMRVAASANPTATPAALAIICRLPCDRVIP